MKKEIKNSELYLRSLTDTKTGFSTPRMYFDDLEKKLSEQIFENTFSKTEGFDVPKSYFNSLEDIILSKVSKENKKPKVISLRNRIFKWTSVGVAATLALFLYLNKINSTKNTLTEDQIISWIQNDLESISSQDLIVAFEDTDLLVETFSSDLISESALENYLQNEDLTPILDDLN